MSAVPVRRRAFLVWGCAVAVYLLAVFNRSSLGVAGLIAAHRFGISAGQLSTFTVLQLLVYAVMQVPVGVLIDRYGPQALIVTGSLTMAGAQLAFGYVGGYPGALIARGFVGVGDAMIFISVLRLVYSWFPARINPVLVAWTALLGQLGALVAAYPLSAALGRYGWTPCFMFAGVTGIGLAVVAVLVVRDVPPDGSPITARRHLRDIGRDLRTTWRDPGTKLGLWSHFTTQFASNTMALLWGYPFFVHAEHRSGAAAAGLLSLLVVVQMIGGPAIGSHIGRHPWRRSTIVLGIVAAIVAMWTIVLLWPGPAPLVVLVLLVVATGLGGPGSMIGFDVARTFTPSSRLGSASGIVNIGGFTASLVVVLCVGLVLDAVTPGSTADYTAGAYRLAMCVQYPLWILGGIQVWRYRYHARRHLRATQPDVYHAMRPAGDDPLR